MKKVICIILVLALCVSMIPAGYADTVIAFSDDPKAIQAASNSVVMLSCYDKDGNLFATGSAFAAFDEGVFVTNFHVIEDAYSIRAQMETGLEFRLDTVVAYDAEKDIAILHTDAKTGLVPLPLGDSSKLERAAKVIAIGSPLGLINTISIGLYSGTIKDDGVYLQFSAPISQGSSGGALFNNSGEVVGITSASYTEGQNLNMAIPIEDAKALYEDVGIKPQMSLDAFYDSVIRSTNNQRYTVEYVLGHLDELNGKTITVEGYIGYINQDLQIAYLIDNPEDSYSAEKADKWVNIWFQGKWGQENSIMLMLNDSNFDDLNSIWHNMSKIVVNGTATVVKQEEDNSFSVFFTNIRHVIPDIDDENNNSSDYTPFIPTYTVAYVRKNYEELDGKEIMLKGYISYGNIMFNSKEQVVVNPTLGFAENDWDIARWLYKMDSMETGIVLGDGFEDSNIHIGDYLCVIGVLSIQKTSDGKLYKVLICDPIVVSTD